MGSVHGLGTRAADFTPAAGANAGFAAQLADVLRRARRVDHGRLRVGRHRRPAGRSAAPSSTVQTQRAFVHPVFFGSAITGAGIDGPDGRPSSTSSRLPMRDAGGPASGRVFKIERGPAGEKIAYVRMFSGTIRTRDRMRSSSRREGNAARARSPPSASSTRRRGRQPRRPCAGEIAKVWGLTDSPDRRRDRARARARTSTSSPRRRSKPVVAARATRATGRGCASPSTSSPSRTR